jgi:hypothetical protein
VITESCDDVGKKEDIEDISNEGKESSQTLVCNDSKCDDVYYFSTSEEENLEIVCVEFDSSLSHGKNRRRTIMTSKES